LGGRSTLIPIDAWRVVQEQGSQSHVQDAYSNQAIYITAQVINELAGSGTNMNEATLQKLWADLQTWVVERPPSLQCIMEVEASGNEAFPIILFSNPSAGMIYQILP